MDIFDFYKSILSYSARKNVDFFIELYLSLLTVALTNIIDIYDKLINDITDDDKKKIWRFIMGITREISHINEKVSNSKDDKMYIVLEEKIDKLIEKLKLINELLGRMGSIDNNK